MSGIYKILETWYLQAEEANRKAILSLCPNGNKLLDLGCGDVAFTLSVAGKSGATEIYGVEIEASPAAVARYRGIIIRQSDLNQELPFEDKAFDLVHANQVIEHLSDTDMLIRESFRVLKPGGNLILSTNNLASIHCIFFLLLGMQPPPCHVSDKFIVGTGIPKRGVQYSSSSTMPQHRRIFTMKALCELLSCYGFHIERSVGVGFYPFHPGIARVICKIEKTHAVYITIVARRKE